MDIELTKIQLVHEFEELAEEYDVAVSNERLWAKGAPDNETAEMHEQNAEHCAMMAKMYRNMAKYPDTIIKLFMED